jgi:hypothetical protein
VLVGAVYELLRGGKRFVRRGTPRVQTDGHTSMRSSLTNSDHTGSGNARAQQMQIAETPE